MHVLKAAKTRGMMFDTRGEAYVFTGDTTQKRLHHFWPGRTDPFLAHNFKGQIRAYGCDLFMNRAHAVRQVFDDGVERETLVAMTANGYRASPREVVWIDLDERKGLGTTDNRVPIGGTTLLDLGSSRRADDVPGKFGYIQARELFGLSRPEDWQDFEFVVCGDHVAVSLIPNHYMEVRPKLAVFARDRPHEAVVHEVPGPGSDYSYQWFVKLSRGFAQSIEAGRWRYYPTGPAEPYEIQIPPDDRLFDVCGDVYLCGGGSSGVRLGRVGGDRREYRFHGTHRFSNGGALGPDGLTGFAWTGTELVQFDIDI